VVAVGKAGGGGVVSRSVCGVAGAGGSVWWQVVWACVSATNQPTDCRPPDTRRPFPAARPPAQEARPPTARPRVRCRGGPIVNRVGDEKYSGIQLMAFD